MVMSDQLIIFLGISFPLVVFFLVGFGTLYWLTKSGKYTKIKALEELKKERESFVRENTT